MNRTFGGTILQHFEIMTSQFSAEVPHRLDMTLDVDWDVNPQIKQTKVIERTHNTSYKYLKRNGVTKQMLRRNDSIALVTCFTHNLQARLVLDLLFDILLLISKYLGTRLIESVQR